MNRTFVLYLSPCPTAVTFSQNSIETYADTPRIGTISYSHTAACTSPSVGYTLPSTYFGESPSSQAQTVIIRGLAGSLILNPIAAGFAGVSLFFAVTAWFCSSRISEIVSSLPTSA